jgi:hypothetical protein
MLKPWEYTSRNIPTHFITVIIVIFEAMLPILNDLQNAHIIDFTPWTGTGLRRNQHNYHGLQSVY